MTADINDIYEFTRFILNKNLLNMKPVDFNMAFNKAQLQLFKTLFGKTEDYQFGRPVSRISYEMTQKISDDLKPFKSDPVFLSVNAQGKASYPSDYVHPIALRAMIVPGGDEANYNDSIKVIDEDELGGRLSSLVKRPSLKRPIAVFYPTYIQFYPKEMAGPTLVYLKYPTDATWAYTTVNSRPVYNANSSVQPKWSKINTNDLVIRTVGFFGVNLKAAQVEQYAQLKQQEGI